MNRADKKYRRLIILEALFLTVAFHFALLLLFRNQPETILVKRQDNGRAALLQLDNLAPEQQTTLRRWLEIHDPRHVTRSDTPYSPTAGLKPLPRSWPDDLAPPILERPLPDRQASLPLLFETGTSRDRRSFEPLSSQPAFTLPEEHYPQVRLNGVLRSELAIPPAVQELARSLDAGGNSFIVQKLPDTGLVRFRVKQNSEHDNLELQLIRALLPQLPPLLKPGSHELEIRWQAERSS